MLILDGSFGSDISTFLTRLSEETLPCKIILYSEWMAKYASHSVRPECFFVFKKMYRRMQDKKNIKIKNLFYGAPFDTFYCVLSPIFTSFQSGSPSKKLKMGQANGGTNHHPKGIIYMRVMPEIAFKRSSFAKASADRLPSQPESDLTLEHIQQIYQQKNEQFIENKNSTAALQDLPVLVLNGNIDFQTDFSQFYSHLFYIKRFLQQIQERQEMALGIHKEKTYRRCC
jgi:hypothetical protein